jgi:hypothetical protein
MGVSGLAASPTSADGRLAVSYDRAIWLAIFIVTSLIVAAGAGFITWLISKSAGKAILSGAAAFAGSIGLFIAMATFINSAPGKPVDVVPPGRSTIVPDVEPVRSAALG